MAAAHAGRAPRFGGHEGQPMRRAARASGIESTSGRTRTRPRARARVEWRRAPEAQARMPRAGERHRYNILAGWLNVSHLAD